MRISEYYKKTYLPLHQNIICRRLHIAGQVATIFFILFSLNVNPWLLLLSPFVVYPFAWSGHYFFEKNKPAAFKNPLFAKISDWLMFWDWVLGRIKR